MRIVQLLNDLETGGAQTLVEQLCKASLEDDTHVVVLGAEGALSPRLAEVARSVTHLGIDRSSNNLFAAVRRYREVVRRVQPEIVHSHLFQSNFLAEVAGHSGARSIWTLHTSGHGVNDRARTRMLIRALKVVQKRSDVVVCCSRTAREWADGMGLQAGPTIFNGVELIAEPMADYESNTVLNLARAHPMKDHRTLFDAASQLGAEVSIICAGTGVEELVLPPRLRRSGSAQVELLGSLADTSGLWRGSSLFVLSSAFGEALPMAGLEALARGVPVVTTDVGDCRILAVEPWMVVPPGDGPALAAAMQRYFSLPLGERERLGSVARQLAARRFSAVDCARAYRVVYEGAR